MNSFYYVLLLLCTELSSYPLHLKSLAQLFQQIETSMQELMLQRHYL
jgi:hypothetical protein